MVRELKYLFQLDKSPKQIREHIENKRSRLRTRSSNQNGKNLKRILEDEDFPSSEENEFEYDSEDSIELTNG